MPFLALPWAACGETPQNAPGSTLIYRRRRTRVVARAWSGEVGRKRPRHGGPVPLDLRFQLHQATHLKPTTRACSSPTTSKEATVLGVLRQTRS
jgi:hypothetical protein